MATADLKRDVVYKQIKDLILTGFFPMGSKISEGVLENTLRANKAPIRDALKRLQAERLVERKPKSGTFVFSLSQAELDDLLHFRFLIESEALKLSLKRDGQALSEEIEAVIASMHEALSQGAISEYLRLDSRFHALTVSHCRNQFFTDSYSLISAMMDTVRNVLGTSKVHLQRSAEEHELMAKAIAAGDADAFINVLRRHVLAECGSYWSPENVGAQLSGEA